MSPYVLSPGFRERDRAAVVALLRAYEAGLGVSLCFQDFDAELAALPGDYVPPRGELVLARAPPSGELVGCVAVRSQNGSSDVCEMKRLYVTPAARGTGLGRRLAIAAIETARGLGYMRMCLDTLPTLHEAHALYDSLGFRRLGTAGTDPTVLLFQRDLA
jgi:GNAT superfamily N-acetyltransferase